VKKASDQGKHVIVDNGTVSIDGCVMFSLEQGYISRNG